MLRLAAIQKLGGKCIRCGYSDHRALQFDHVNGDGIRAIRGTNQLTRYRRILDGTTVDVQLLCANCNWIKRSENDEQPKRDYVSSLQSSTDAEKVSDILGISIDQADSLIHTLKSQ